jgi:hypothetical protein
MAAMAAGMQPVRRIPKAWILKAWVLKAWVPQGNESRLTRLWLQRAENVQQVLRVPGGALAAALD